MTSLVVATASCEEEQVAPSTGTRVIYGDPLETALVPYPSDRFTVIDRSTATLLRVS
ncbi:MAG: hypothetical protein HOV80_00590, partial [Polyangiaceae bacterium]|nr:hypothetical protein [Polyangiaceae bacterium]